MLSMWTAEGGGSDITTKTITIMMMTIMAMFLVVSENYDLKPDRKCITLLN